jgi:hypothetical protein
MDNSSNDTKNIKSASAWNELLNFLWDGGSRSIIVLTFAVGSIYITLNNQKICPGMPSITPSRESKSDVILVQPNPICSKYFELIFMVIGGYLGLSLPRGMKSQPAEPTEPTEPIKPAEPTEPIKPAEPIKPTEPTEPTEIPVPLPEKKGVNDPDK